MKMKALLILFSFAFCSIANGQFSVLTDFTGNNSFIGSYPMQDQNLVSDGTYLYGMTAAGGLNNCGTIFKILPNGTGYEKLFDFDGLSTGNFPQGSLIFDGTYLYGMTEMGGSPNSCGSIFKILPDGTGFVKLFSFCGNSDAALPYGSLLYDGTYLYGMTKRGGDYDMGIIFKILPNGSGYVKLLDFNGASNGSYPRGNLITDGTFLYGMTPGGGINDCGTVFKIMPNGTGYMKLLDFNGYNGLGPNGSLLFDGTYLIGLTSDGGTNGYGTIFKILPNGTGFITIHVFDNVPSGSYPLGSLISDGTFLYGMTNEGGTNDLGTIFKILPNGTGFSKIFDFAGSTNGSKPKSSLFFDGNFLFGMTSMGGPLDKGILFKVQPNGTGFVDLFDFSHDINGANPYGSLISDGTYLYGMTTGGGLNNVGTLFKIMPDGTGFLKLHDFGGTFDGTRPCGSLLFDGTYLYGMTNSGGNHNMGTIFKILPDGTGYIKLFDFAGVSNGKNPYGSLIFDGTFLYGMAFDGGSNNLGTIFKILPNGGGYMNLLDFDNTSNGCRPFGSLFFDGNYLYGVTYNGGPNNFGTIFKILPDGTGYMKLFDFGGSGSPLNGYAPFGSLISDGVYLYGSTGYGGLNNSGTIFKIMPDGTGFSILHDFSGASNGSTHIGSLTLDGNFLYGRTKFGGNNDTGILFRLMTDGTGFIKLFDYDSVYNFNPYYYSPYPQEGLYSDGTYLYGMTQLNGIAHSGTVYKFNMTTIGIPENNNAMELTVFPNPTNGIVSINGITNETIYVYNSLGEKIFNLKGKNKIDLSLCSSGLYFIQILNNNGKMIANTKVLKQ
jgi:uncharacterized repeat protein (TIGR03803 family)